MKKRNQKGFGHIALIFGVVVLLAIGFAAWRVYQDKYIKTPTPESSNTEPTESTSSVEQEIKIPDDWIWFEDKEKSVKFAHPKTWGELLEISEGETVNGSIEGKFVHRIEILNKDFQISILKGYQDYIWYLWDSKEDQLVESVDANPPAYEELANYNRPNMLGESKKIEAKFTSDTDFKVYYVLGKGAMNCGAMHYFFMINGKVVHMVADLCGRGGSWEPNESQEYLDVFEDQIQDLYKYVN